MRSPVRIWPAAPESTQLRWKLGAFCFSGSSRTGDLTREARFDKNRRLPRAVSASSRQPRSGLVPCGNLASSSIVVAKSALRPRFFYTKIAIRPLPCFSSPTQTHFVGLCVGISVKRFLSRIRLFCVYFVLKSGGLFSPTHTPTHGRRKVRKYRPENGSN